MCDAKSTAIALLLSEGRHRLQKRKAERETASKRERSMHTRTAWR